MFDKLSSFVFRNGNVDIPRNNKENEVLSRWLGRQRKLFRKNKLHDSKIEKLKTLNIDLAYNRSQVYDNIWMQRYNELAQYFNHSGHSDVSGRDEKNKSLGQWVLVQRREKKNGVLEDFKIELLNKLNFSWSKKHSTFKPNNHAWEAKYNLLIKYKSQFSTTVVPQSNKELGRWVNDQRVNYKRQKLSQLQIDKLNEIGFVWVAKK